ncbi:MAG: outer membrane protein assembly factor BamA [Gammaproteobacteria bacterium]|nr:outer membrane protein assembly factor BamA [Gammaproteobacteria bacterium]MCH9717817.1 outer membrane protein assembly factor BamA [Gammaproteobacteria bacterium]MCH9763744.1 outer membrane protein assembly factor BamA [Gammaproteobacteria bacterium]
MKNIRNKNKQTWMAWCCFFMLLWSFGVEAASSYRFVVRDIKITGLQRVSTGTVLNYLPVQVGEEIGPEATPRIIRALYDTGFFQSVVLEREGNTLIVQVVERATVGSISVKGNKDIPNDKMKEILKELGLVKGRVFQRASLERLEKEMKIAYNARGKYNARIQSTVTPLAENRVNIDIDISEGRISRIKEVKIIGNHDFTEEELKSEIALSGRSVFAYFTKKDQYSKTGMDASVEALRSFYLNHGYLKFTLVSSQVLLSPDKKDVFIHIHIEEGQQYHFSGYTFSGNTIVSKQKLNDLIDIKSGDVFSRKKVTESISAISLSLGDLGYGFPAINADPRINEKDKTVFITFMVDPGRHVYVRRINFHGNTKTGDYVLRNMMHQDEGSLLSLHNIKESERQLRLLNYLKDINVKTTPVPKANNLVDLDVALEETPSAEASASAGYGTTGPQFNASVNQYNFMGTGRTVGFTFNATYWGLDYAFNYYNPFYTNTGTGRGVALYFQTVDPKKLDVSQYSANRFGGDVNYNLLLSERSSAQFGYGYQGLNIQSPGNLSQIQAFEHLYGRDFYQIRLSGGWNKNSYDQMPYPNKGTNQQASALIALPATSKSFQYFKLAYQAHTYKSLGKGWIATILVNAQYGNQFDSTGLPFYENYFAGGIAMPGQVRGFESYSLGPRDSNGTAIGANLLLNGSAGLVLPYPLSRETIRTTLFVDTGNVFVAGTPEALTGIDQGPMRYSAGVSVEWRSPFGPLVFSAAQPLNKQPYDKPQPFQFTLASGF